jgi:5-methylcytosine-specific restriction protein B
MLAMKTVTRITDNDSLVDELSALLGIEGGQLSSAPRELAPLYTVEDFEEETAIPAETIRLWERRFKRKQHIILQGPPGTGKTFIAERLARLLIGGTAGFCETVQFHPSYSYEDFMQGIRPVVQNEELVFQRMAGRFMRFCEKARHVEDEAPCVMIIDEINRGNLSRVFGELMYLLEYRDKTIPLAGEERLFGIPPNVYIIGTMNTADRSIALVDHALRRRFTFIHLGTDYDVLRKQLAKVGLASDGLVATLRALNKAIGDPNYEIGISPFLKDGALLAETLKDVWEGEIEPYLEEYFYDQSDKTAAFRWKEVSGRLELGTAG